MTLDATLDAAVAAADRADWLDARREGFGCSDLGALWIILGWAGEDVYDWHEVTETIDGKAKRRWVSDLYATHPETGERDYVTPRYLHEAAAVMKSNGLPRLIAEKVGRAKPRAQSDAQAEGVAKERALWQSSPWGRWDATGYYAPDDAAHAPAEWLTRAVHTEPLVIRDAVEPRLLATVEAWAPHDGGACAIELKTDRLGLRTRPPWAQKWQAVGQATVLGAEYAAIVYGPRWAQTDLPAFPDLGEPVVWGPWRVTDEQRAMVRRAAHEGWALVESAKAGKMKAPGDA